MKFVDAWDSLAKENSSLKYLLSTITVISLFLAAGWMKESSKPALVLDRGCDTRKVPLKSDQVTEDEIRSFLSEAIQARFNSRATQLHFLSYKQKVLREDEQKEMQARSMTQTVFVQDVQFDKDKITILADRLISLGEIRSAFKFPLTVKVEMENRTASNPYGLILTEVDQNKDKEVKR